jgi:hypothetical protein
MAALGNPYRVYEFFQDRYGWQVQFLEADLKAPLPRKLHLNSSDKIIELIAGRRPTRLGKPGSLRPAQRLVLLLIQLQPESTASNLDAVFEGLLVFQ